MDNDHVATPFREILASIIKPHPLPVELPLKTQPTTRFHPDDIEDALNVLLWHWPADNQSPEASARFREAFSRCLVSLDDMMRRREEESIDAFHAYEQEREEQRKRAAWTKLMEDTRHRNVLNALSGGIAPQLHDSDSEPMR